MEETAPVWYILTGDRTCLDDKEFEVLDALGLSVSAQRRLAGNAVVRPQARLMLQRGLTAINNERNL